MKPIERKPWIDGQIAYLPLSNGLATIDAADIALVSPYKWLQTRGGYVRTYGFDARKPRLSMHRVIMNAKDGELVDHINHFADDNRRCNLRLATGKQNMQNTLKTKTLTTSQYKGVCFQPKTSAKNPWVAKICVDGERMLLGWFPTEFEAALAYDIAALKHFGQFACINF